MGCTVSSDPSRLVLACDVGDVATVKNAIKNGADVNGRAKGRDDSPLTPLRAAVARRHHAVAAVLLAAGVDPNADDAMACCADTSTPPAILQLLVDAGGDVNRGSGGPHPAPPVFLVLRDGQGDPSPCLRVLLSEPGLDLAVTDAADGKTAEQYARTKGKPGAADIIRNEVCVAVAVFALVAT